MDYLSSGNHYAYLSLADLLLAREQFHAHLVHKRHVIGTAVGRYLIRHDDPPPGVERTTPKGARTLENSEVREYSWPCVLVFVDRWVDESAFGKGELATSDYVPKTIYMPDGKAVPVCLVLAPRILTPPDTRPAPEVEGEQMQGGLPIVAKTQGAEYRATIGCLVTDGHKIYALTARHVAGASGEEVGSIGTSSSYQLSRVPFESVYAPWPGKHAFVNLDVALVEIDDVTKWSSGIQSIGPIGPLAALSTYNLSLNLIGCPVRAHGGASGPLTGRIAALFYRYKSVGGFDYMADFLIGGRENAPLPTLPGDSGAVWVVDSNDNEYDRNQPIAVQWGGTVLGTSDRQSTFALASNLSTICRELNVDLYRGPNVAAFEYWGPIGHAKIAEFASLLVEDANLATLLKKNFSNLGTLANFPDTLFKTLRPNERENHYADVDLAQPGIRSLVQQTPNIGSISLQVWRTYYDKINANPATADQVNLGLLPFRVAQVFNDLKRIVANGDTEEIVAAMVILAHYVGDACQPLHSSYLSDGDPFRSKSGANVSTMLGHGKGFGGGVHSAYESTMIRDEEGKLSDGVHAKIDGQKHGLGRIDTGRKAAWAALELMQRSRNEIDPMDLVNFYGAGNKSSSKLWNKYGTRTIDRMVDGSRVLAMLWDSAWEGNDVPSQQLTKKTPARLKAICSNTNFLESFALGDVPDDVLD